MISVPDTVPSASPEVLIALSLVARQKSFPKEPFVLLPLWQATRVSSLSVLMRSRSSFNRSFQLRRGTPNLGTLITWPQASTVL